MRERKKNVHGNINKEITEFPWDNNILIEEECIYLCEELGIQNNFGFLTLKVLILK